MRLTDDIMRASEDATIARIGNALILAAAGRFGLLPSARPFQLALNISSDSVEIQALDCLAVTRGGNLIDVQFDTKYTNHLDNRVLIPNGIGKNEMFLTISVDPKRWEETLNGYEEPIYSFSLIGVNSPVPDTALPIAHLVYLEQVGGWHIDEEDFLPPCLFVSSHWKYMELLNQFVQNLSEIESKVFRQLQGGTNDTFFSIFWPLLQQVFIDTDKSRDLMTPMTFLANIQKLVAAFTSSCKFDKDMTLTNADSLRNYALTPYYYANTYSMIKQGLKFCLSINNNMDQFETKTPEPQKTYYKLEAPYISDDQLYQKCRSSTVSVPVINNVQGAKLLYSTDGSMPLKPVPADGKIRIKNKFNAAKEPEPDQNVTVKLKAFLNGSESDVNTFIVILHKDYNVWIKI